MLRSCSSLSLHSLLISFWLLPSHSHGLSLSVIFLFSFVLFFYWLIIYWHVKRHEKNYSFVSFVLLLRRCFCFNLIRSLFIKFGILLSMVLFHFTYSHDGSTARMKSILLEVKLIDCYQIDGKTIQRCQLKWPIRYWEQMFDFVKSVDTYIFISFLLFVILILRLCVIN